MSLLRSLLGFLLAFLFPKTLHINHNRTAITLIVNYFFDSLPLQSGEQPKETTTLIQFFYPPALRR